MSDIVERLRSTEFASAPNGLGSPVTWVKGTVAREAADEIERLRAALQTARRDALEEAEQAVAKSSQRSQAVAAICALKREGG